MHVIGHHHDPASRKPYRARTADGKERRLTAIARADTPEEVSYYRHGGILQYVLRQMLTTRA